MKKKIIKILRVSPSKSEARLMARGIETKYQKGIANQILELIKEDKIQEYRNGYNDCLKDQKLTGERWEHLYL